MRHNLHWWKRCTGDMVLPRKHCWLIKQERHFQMSQFSSEMLKWDFLFSFFNLHVNIKYVQHTVWKSVRENWPKKWHCPDTHYTEKNNKEETRDTTVSVIFMEKYGLERGSEDCDELKRNKTSKSRPLLLPLLCLPTGANDNKCYQIYRLL